MKVSVKIEVDFGEKGYAHTIEVSQAALDDVRYNFNPSGLPSVDHLKLLAAAFITQNMSNLGPYSGRDCAEARTFAETACMWAVKGATASLGKPEVIKSDAQKEDRQNYSANIRSP